MNKKAERFQAFLDEKEIKNAFQMEETNDKWDTVIFRSQIDINSNKLPTMLLFDTSVYGLMRVLIAPKLPSEENEAAVLKLINGYNKRLKAFKYYVDDDGALLMDVCLLAPETEDPGPMVYAMYDVIIQHLTECYKDIMRSVWG
ncbi:MAG: hypothetical protein IJS96_10900 [Schwartzia sp.]|nr:hypothetical protein [Schwartzia sp. (in: firmicutes)]